MMSKKRGFAQGFALKAGAAAMLALSLGACSGGLFGGGYAAQALDMIDRLLAELGH